MLFFTSKAYNNELGIAYFAVGDYDNAFKIFDENLKNIKDKNNNLTINSLNNIGSTSFAKKNVLEALDTFYEVLEVQRSWFIQNFSSQLQPNKIEDDMLDMKSSLRAISYTLNNLAYVYAYMRDASTSSFFLETAVTINNTLHDSSSSLTEDSSSYSCDLLFV